MTTLSAPLAVKATFPALELTSPGGNPVAWADARGTGPALVYFMRTVSCPMCHQHVRQIGSMQTPAGAAAARTVVVVPGDASDAAAVERRHPALTGRVFASETAHEAVGLFVKMGMQQSGSYVIDGSDRITYAKTATMPVGTFSEREAAAALG